jgi:hypothetical protein
MAIRQELVATYPDCCRPDLANSLTNLGVTFFELGAWLKQKRSKEEAEPIRAGYGDS